MQFGLSASERALQESARAFAQEFVAPRAAEVDRSGEYPWEIVTALAKAGFCGMTIPEAYGGKGLSYFDAVLVIEEMAKACTVTARIVVETNMGAIATVMEYGSEAQKKLAAELVIAGDKPAICITEPEAGSDALAMGLRVPAAVPRCRRTTTRISGSRSTTCRRSCALRGSAVYQRCRTCSRMKASSTSSPRKPAWILWNSGCATSTIRALRS